MSAVVRLRDALATGLAGRMDSRIGGPVSATRTREVTIEDLQRALTSAHGEAVATCREVLSEPGGHLHVDKTGRHRAYTANLVAIYRRRASEAEDLGLPTLGFPETIERLEATRHDTLRLAVFEGRKGFPWCVVFLAPDGPDVVAALAVLGPAV